MNWLGGYLFILDFASAIFQILPKALSRSTAMCAELGPIIFLLFDNGGNFQISRRDHKPPIFRMIFHSCSFTG